MEKDKILSLIDSLSKQDIEYDSIIEYIESIKYYADCNIKNWNLMSRFHSIWIDMYGSVLSLGELNKINKQGGRYDVDDIMINECKLLLDSLEIESIVALCDYSREKHLSIESFSGFVQSIEYFAKQSLFDVDIISLFNDCWGDLEIINASALYRIDNSHSKPDDIVWNEQYKYMAEASINSMISKLKQFIDKRFVVFLTKKTENICDDTNTFCRVIYSMIRLGNLMILDESRRKVFNMLMYDLESDLTRIMCVSFSEVIWEKDIKKDALVHINSLVTGMQDSL